MVDNVATQMRHSLLKNIKTSSVLPTILNEPHKEDSDQDESKSELLGNMDDNN